MGNIFYIMLVLFPFFVFYILNDNFNNRYGNPIKKEEFVRYYGILTEGLRNSAAISQYYSLYLFRKMLFAFIVFYLKDEQWMLFQVMSNYILSMAFTVYLFSIHPFFDNWENNLQLINEISFVLISLIYICFTDFNPNPEIKVNCGWLIIVICILNLIWPNFYYLA